MRTRKPRAKAIQPSRPLHRGWFQIHPGFLAALWNLKPTGRTRVNRATGMIEIEVEDANITKDGTKLWGRVTYSITAATWEQHDATRPSAYLGR